MEIVREVTLDEIEALSPATVWACPVIASGRRGGSCWWTTDPAHLYVRSGNRVYPRESIGGRQMLAERGAFDCDPKGYGVAPFPAAFWFTRAQRSAEEGRFGSHGIRSFLAAFHGCAVVSLERSNVPWSSDRWHDYGAALDRFDARKAAA